MAHFQDTYTLHKSVRKSFPGRQILIHGIDDQWQIDLVYLSSLSRVNENYRFLLMCINVSQSTGGAYEGQICKIIDRRSRIHIHHFKENAN